MQTENKLIYLDWNIFQDIVQKRDLQELEEILSAARKRGYIIPYSYSHIRDLARCSNNVYIDSDLKFIEKFTDGYVLYYSSNDESKFYIEKKSPFEVMKMEKNRTEGNFQPKRLFCFYPYKVDTSSLSEENLLMPYLRKSNNIMSMELIESIQIDLYPKIFEDYTLQKKFLSSLKESIVINNPAFAFIENLAILKNCFSDKETIKQNFSDIFDGFLSLSNKTQNSIPFGEKITTAYNMMSFLPAFSERIMKRNNVNNISTDAEHILFATSSKYLVTNDKNMAEKTSFLYNHFGIKTKVFLKSDFTEKVSFI